MILKIFKRFKSGLIYTSALQYICSSLATIECASNQESQIPASNIDFLEKHKGIISQINGKWPDFTWNFNLPSDLTDSEFFKLTEKEKLARFLKYGSAITSIANFKIRFETEKNISQTKLILWKDLIKLHSNLNLLQQSFPEINCPLAKLVFSKDIRETFKAIHSSIEDPEVLKKADNLVSEISKLYENSDIDENLMEFVRDVAKASFFGKNVCFSTIYDLIAAIEDFTQDYSMTESAFEIYKSRDFTNVYPKINERVDTREILLQAALIFLDPRAQKAIIKKASKPKIDDLEKIQQDYDALSAKIEELKLLEHDLTPFINRALAMRNQFESINFKL